MITKGQILYYARILPNSGVYDVIDLKIRTVEKDWFCGTDKFSKQAFLFDNEDLERTVFTNRNDALELVHNAEQTKSKFSTETYTYYEEY